ncbi:xanthine dehydrogenase small subunit [Aliidongia dinghuensis]|uniref:Xanthine dehydrogenase small subunit n=1 Tax=Aliidongia dinghuensis TaxID=1867774 RepID=A0A8J3E267_9PROT|nr:xanthine dehydrogenase small subunit [Aliidongia dinghuensis]GGF05934.1 xanthine dehydrogenase small subunit [Aliidongia dinghuensis]
MDRIRFLIDGTVRTLGGFDPTLTVLDYLRGLERRSGTKEGCAEGDCGACTVVLGEPVDGTVRYRAVNACILFMGAVDGKELVTVESLATADGPAHPVQQALVDCHGSQCGFCTPGFVMALYALWRQGGRPTRAEIEEALAGNLCRCTGYRPIVAAAERACAAADRCEPRPVASVAQLAALEPAETLAIEQDGRRFLAPTDLNALAELVLAHPDATLLAGGTDVGLWVTKQLRRLDTVIYLGRVAGLADIAVDAAGITIGAAATYTDAMPILTQRHPEMDGLLRRLGSTQVRNAGTIGGNIANGSPIGDSLPALIALGAVLVLRRGSVERELPIEDFFLGYRQTALAAGEFLARIRVPGAGPTTRFRAYKISKRFDQDISAVCGGFAVTLDDGRVADIRLAFGGMAAVPARARQAEQALLGQPWTEAAVAAALPALALDFSPLSDMRASADYRARVAANLLRKFQLETSGTGSIDVLALAEAQP